MALQQKKKRSQRSKGRAVTRPPKAVLERQPRKRKLPINSITVLAGLFAVCLVGVLIYALVVTLKPETVSGLDEYNDGTADAREELNNVAQELDERIETVRTGEGDPEEAFAAVADLSSRSTEQAQNLRTHTTPAATQSGELGTRQASLALARQSQIAGAMAFSTAADLLLAAKPVTDPAMKEEMIDKSARVARTARALVTFGDDDLLALRNRDTFVALEEDLATAPESDPIAEKPPLLGVPAEQVVDVEVDTSTQADEAWAKDTNETLKQLDAALGTTEATLAAYDTNKDAAALQAAATTWHAATVDAIEAIEGSPRPDGLQDADAALRNSLWLLEESSRSFASVATAPVAADALVKAGKQLRLLSDVVRTSAGDVVEKGTDEKWENPATTGFDPTLIGEAAPSAPAPTGAEGAVPGGIPGGAGQEPLTQVPPG